MSATERQPANDDASDDAIGRTFVEAIRRAWPLASPETIDELSQTASIVRTLPSTLISEGERPGRIVLVLEGHVVATWNAPDGRTVFAGLEGPGQYLGIATLAGSPMSVGIDAVTAVTLLTWDSRRFRHIAAADPAMIGQLLDRAVFAVHGLTHLGKVRTFTTARARLAGLLIQHEQLCFSNHAAPIPRSQLGALAGVTPRMVSRIVRDWEKAGIVRRVGASGLVLLDRAGLATEAAPLADFPAPSPMAPRA
jgi:CRP-like cAMP-binding protein